MMATERYVLEDLRGGAMLRGVVGRQEWLEGIKYREHQWALLGEYNVTSASTQKYIESREHVKTYTEPSTVRQNQYQRKQATDDVDTH